MYGGDAVHLDVWIVTHVLDWPFTFTCNPQYCSLAHSNIHRWLDSSKTLYEQDVKEHDVLYLRWKYFAIKDIDPRVREREGEREREREGGRERERGGEREGGVVCKDEPCCI